MDGRFAGKKEVGTVAVAGPAQRTDPKIVRAYLRTELGRATLRRELVECAHVKEGQQALLLCDTQRIEGMDEVALVAVDMMRELGLKVTVMQVDELIPVMEGAVPGSFAYVDKYKLPKIIFEAARAADIVFDYTTNSRGGQKYNLDLFTLSSDYSRQIVALRTLEIPEALGTDVNSPIANSEALQYPSDLLRVIGQRVNEALYAAAETRQEFRLTNPWGTDLRFTVLPGDVSQLAGGIREYPLKGIARSTEPRLYRALSGFGVTQSCEGTWVTKYCTLLGGELSEPMRIILKDGYIARATGGPEASQLMKLMDEDRSEVHAILFGLHPKVSPFRDGRYLFENNGAGMGIAHLALGAPGLFFRHGEWGPVGNKHFQLGNIPKISVWAGTERVVENGVVLALSDSVVRKAARQYDDPAYLLRPFDWPDVEL